MNMFDLSQIQYCKTAKKKKKKISNMDALWIKCDLHVRKANKWLKA